MIRLRWLVLVLDEDECHLGELRRKTRGLLGIRERLLMLVKLRQNGAELQDEAAVVPSQMNRALQDLTCRPVCRLVVAVEPVFECDLRSFLGFV